MTPEDMVKWLRMFYPPIDGLRDAADMIERLKHERDSLWGSNVQFVGEVERLKAELAEKWLIADSIFDGPPPAPHKNWTDYGEHLIKTKTITGLYVKCIG